MLLSDKTAVIYGAGGAVGSAVARAFAQEGANVFLTGRNLAALTTVADEITVAGGVAEAALVDALDETAIEQHLEDTIRKTGRIDVSFNAAGISGADVRDNNLQGVPLAVLSLESFSRPITTYTQMNFLTARAAARRMAERRSGVILTHTPEPARFGAPLVGGMGPAWAAMESLSRGISAEFGSQGIRAICLRSTGLPETETIEVIFGIHAKAIGITSDQFRGMIEGMTHRRRSSTLKDLADAAVFAASDLSRGMTGAVINLTGGLISD